MLGADLLSSSWTTEQTMSALSIFTPWLVTSVVILTAVVIVTVIAACRRVRRASEVLRQSTRPPGEAPGRW